MTAIPKPVPAACRAALLKLEEDWISNVCTQIAKFKPDVVVTEKGLSDLAIHFLTKAGISAIRRLRKTGASHPESLQGYRRSNEPVLLPHD
jgi:chaperonin GroEL (HSP60 family)